ncbi:MAG: hypothetical protein K8S94_06125 [Planctomycetia bacterium]|nr:hypothetical protein [Planctomycetia bacterium]
MHTGHTEAAIESRAAVLADAHARHPERFVRGRPLRKPRGEGAADRPPQELRICAEDVMATVMIDDLRPFAAANLGIHDKTRQRIAPGGRCTPWSPPNAASYSACCDCQSAPVTGQ